MVEYKFINRNGDWCGGKGVEGTVAYVNAAGKKSDRSLRINDHGDDVLTICLARPEEDWEPPFPVTAEELDLFLAGKAPIKYCSGELVFTPARLYPRIKSLAKKIYHLIVIKEPPSEYSLEFMLASHLTIAELEFLEGLEERFGNERCRSWRRRLMMSTKKYKQEEDGYPVHIDISACIRRALGTED